MSKFLDHKQSGIRATTYGTYKSKLRIFSIWSEFKGFKDNDLLAYSNVILKQFFVYLINIKKLSARSVSKYQELLKAFFDYCISMKYIKRNPVYGIPRCNRINDNTPRPISRPDIEAFKTELRKDSQLWLAVQFEFYCALRPGHEIREMKIKDLDLVTGTVRVTRERAKNHRERIITIPQQLLQELRSLQLQSYDREFYVFGRGGAPGPQYISKNHLTRRFKSIRDRLNMPAEYKLYSWKHTAAVEIDGSKIPTKILSAHFGHSSISVTDIYLKHLKPSVSEELREAYPDL